MTIEDKSITRRRVALWAAAAVAIGLSVGAFVASRAQAAPVGGPAPAFSELDSNGKTRTLEEFKGKTVVLEWTNDGCPFVKAHYSTGHMQALQKEMTANGVVWLSVISSAPGKQGYADGAHANHLTAERGAAPSAVLLDPDGSMGRAYGASATPHMFVIAPDGVLAYQGAIDSAPLAKGEKQANARNYVREATAAVLSGKAVETASTAAYGCPIKYAS